MTTDAHVIPFLHFEIQQPPNFFNSIDNFGIKDYNNKYDSPLNIFTCFKTAFILSFTTFGSLNTKARQIKNYFINKTKLISNESYNSIEQLCNIIPGATNIQTLFFIYFIKTKKIILSLLSILIYILPPLICSIIFCYNFNSFLINITQHNTTLSDLLIYIKEGLCLISLGIIIHFILEEIIKISQSNFQVGLIIIDIIILLIHNSLLTMVILLIISGYLCYKNKESEYLIMRIDTNVKQSIIEYTIKHKYFSILGNISLILYVTIFIALIVDLYYDIIWEGEEMIKIYFISSFVFIDYAALAIILCLFEFNIRLLLISFAIVMILPGGHILNVLIVMLTALGNNQLVYILFIGMFCYLPSVFSICWFTYFMPWINENVTLQFWLIGMKTCTLSFVIRVFFQLFYVICIKNEIYGGTLSTSLVIVICLCLKKKYTLLSIIIGIGLSVLLGYVMQ
jgi:chromate transport protein ChrA